MPGAYGGSFPEWEKKNQAKRPNKGRNKLLRQWVQNLIKAEEVRLTGNRWVGPWCGVSPYHHFSDDDIKELRQIAREAGSFSDVDNMVNKMLREHEIAVEEFELLKKLEELIAKLGSSGNTQTNLKAELVVRHQELVELEKAIQQQRELAEQYEAKRQIMEKRLADERTRVESLRNNIAPEEYCDIIFTTDLMKKPVVAADGFTYERESIELWFKTKNTSPNTGAVLLHKNLIPNNSLMSQINQWKEKQSGTSDPVAAVAAVGAAVDKAVTASVSAVSAGIASINPSSGASVRTAGVATINPRSVASVGTAGVAPIIPRSVASVGTAGVASINPRPCVSVGTAGVTSINHRSTKKRNGCVIC